MQFDETEKSPRLFADSDKPKTLEQKSCREIIEEYGRATQEQVQYLMSCTPKELTKLLEEIKIIKCFFHHDRADIDSNSKEKPYTPGSCNLREINAACGHQGFDKYFNWDENNAIAKITKAIVFLEALGEDCNIEREILYGVASNLHNLDASARLQDKLILIGKQETNGDKVIQARDGVQKKLEVMLSKLYAGKIAKTNAGIPENPNIIKPRRRRKLEI